jgi:hypothetical protein
MRIKGNIILLAGLLAAGLCFGRPALAAEEVTVFQPRAVEVGGEVRQLSPSDLRVRALRLGFVEALAQSALKMLPAGLGEDRAEALRAYLETRTDDWVLGYSELASEASEEGIRMVLSVDVNRRALRDELERFGIGRADAPLHFTLIPAPTLTPEDRAALGQAMLLLNAADTPGYPPAVRLERTEAGIRGELESPSGRWTAMDKDVAFVWFALWERQLAASAERQAPPGGVLTVSGWFSPDGAHDFDRVLHEWDDLVRTARLEELDLLTAGVSGRWRIAAVDGAKLKSRLEGYLPQRGLSFTYEAE